MILLLGGTSETSQIARELAETGYRILVSTATDIPLKVEAHPNVSRREGPLDEKGMALMIVSRGIRAIVDCAHPYAERVHATARYAAEAAGIPCFMFLRPESHFGDKDVFFAADHEEAARIACSCGCPVFLATGSRNLEPYVREAKKAGVKLAVRVLPEKESLQACGDAGIAAPCIITGRGPFSVEKNREDIRRFGTGVLVTKDSGTVGGMREKVEAARLEGCRIVVLRRPKRPAGDVFEDPGGLMDAVLEKVPKG